MAHEKIITALRTNRRINKLIRFNDETDPVPLVLTPYEAAELLAYIEDLQNQLCKKCDNQKNAARLAKSCPTPCTASDWKPGGKCDVNGCYHE